MPVGLPHAVSSESVRVGPYSVPRGHSLIGNFGVLLKVRADHILIGIIVETG